MENNEESIDNNESSDAEISPRMKRHLRQLTIIFIISAISTTVMGYSFGRTQSSKESTKIILQAQELLKIIDKQTQQLNYQDSLMRRFQELLKINPDLKNQLQNKSDSINSKPHSSGNGSTSC